MAKPGVPRRCVPRSAGSTPPTASCARWPRAPSRSCARACARSCATARPYVAQPPARPPATSAPPAPTCASRSSSSTASSTSRPTTPNGREGLTGNLAQDLNRDEGLLFWLGWVAHNTNSMFSTSDASGPYRRFIILATCTTYQQLLLDNGAAAPLVEDALGPEGPARRLGPLPADDQGHAQPRPDGRDGGLHALVLRRCCCSCGCRSAAPIPLRPEGYRFEVGFKEASLLVKEADVRMAGLNVGKVKAKRLDAENGDHGRRAGDRRAVRADPQGHQGAAADQGAAGRDLRGAHARRPRRAQAGGRRAAARAGGRGGGGDRRDHLAVRQAHPARTSRAGSASWRRRSTRAAARTSTTRSATCRGSWPPATTCSPCSTRRSPRCGALVRNSGRALNAVNERRGQLRELIGNANDFFGALASRNESLAEAVFIFPTFLDESKATLRAAEDVLGRHAAAGARPRAGGARPAPDPARRRARSRPT